MRMDGVILLANGMMQCMGLAAVAGNILRMGILRMGMTTTVAVVPGVDQIQPGCKASQESILFASDESTGFGRRIEGS